FMTSLEEAVLLINICMAILSITLNILLTFIVFRYTPAKVSTFGIMLKFHALIDLYISVGSSATMICLIPIEWSLIYVFYGPCGYFGSTVCYVFSVVMIGGEGYSVQIDLTSFVFRLMVIRGNIPKFGTAISLTGAICLPIPTVLSVCLTIIATLSFIFQLIFLALKEDDDRIHMLSALAALPLIPAIGIFTFFIGFFDIIHHPALESSTFLVS
ncbi:hypothetical protein PENTCL1PPCAC_14727, partial [Pristionchus entomophagus]